MRTITRFAFNMAWTMAVLGVIIEIYNMGFGYQPHDDTVPLGLRMLLGGVVVFTLAVVRYASE